MVRISQRIVVVFASAVLIVSGCTDKNVEGESDLASEQA
jgi:hypothetical protein